MTGTVDLVFDFHSIQSAIDAAGEGDTIIVAAGTYNETIDVATSDLTIQSVSGNPSDTTIDGSGLGVDGGVTLDNVVTIANCSGVTLSGFTITGVIEGRTGFTEGNGILMEGAAGCTISNIVVTKINQPAVHNWNGGICLTEGSTGNSFDSVEVSGMKSKQPCGILIDSGSDSNTFKSTTISGITSYPVQGGQAKGIWVNGAENNKFVDTKVTDITGFSGAEGINANGKGNTFTSTEVSGIQTSKRRAVGIQIHQTAGVEFSDYHVSDITATDSEFYSSGIRVKDGVTDCTFSSGSITGAGIGFFVDSSGDPCTGNSIHNTNLAGNTDWGVKNDVVDETLDAANNWWGTTVDADIQAMISGNVLYIPISTEPY
ncbi:hypothetical protein ES708_28761 [subsurface metagenome]